MKWIRWKGVVAFFLVTCALVVCFKWYAQIAVKKMIEVAGSRAVGAKVELSDVSLSVIPLGMTLYGLAVTNPDEPMSNLFDVATIRFSIDPGRLLLGKMIIDDMSVDGIRLNTPRETSGELLKQPEKEKKINTKEDEKKSKEASFTLPSLDIPDVKDVLAKESLAVIEEGKALKKDMGALKDDIETRIENLPDKKDFDAYKQRIKDLRPQTLSLGSLMGKLDELKHLKKDIKKDVDAIESLKDDVRNGIRDYKKRIEALPAIADAEVKRLKNKYAPSQGMGNVSALIFGPKSSAWVTRGLSLYQKIKPLLEKDDRKKPEEEKTKEAPARGKGVDVAFKESHPMPDVLVKHAALSVNLDSGILKGDLYQATNEQNITGKPIRFAFESKELLGIKELTIDGQVDRVKVKEPVDSLKASVNGLSLDAMVLAKKSAMGIRVSKAMAHVDMDLTVAKDQLDGTVSVSLTPVVLAPLGEGGDEHLKKVLGKSLSGVTALNVKGVLSGQVSDYHLDLSSDLDNLLKKVVNDMLTSLADDFSKELEAKIQQKVREKMAALTGDLDGFSGFDKDLAQRLKQGKNVLKGL